MDNVAAGRHEPCWYEIRLQGRLDARWATWFDGMTVTTETETETGTGTGDGALTVLRGRVVDQAALHGVLARLRDVGLPLVSVARVDETR